MTLIWAVLSVSYILSGDAAGALFLWFTAMLGVSLALDVSVLWAKS